MISNSNDKNISIKEINKKQIFKIILEKGPISRIDISKYLNISRPTTSAYIGELIEDGLIEEIGKGPSTTLGGKKAVLIKVNEKAGYIFGIMIGVNTIRIAIMDLKSSIINVIKIPTEEWNGPAIILENIIKNLKNLIKESGIDIDEVIGIGIGVPGLVDSKSGIVIFSPNLEGWSNIKLKEEIEKSMGLPTFIENECRIQAIAEKKFGLAKDLENFLCFETGIGIGTGVFINNKILTGNKSIAGELGHIITNITGTRVCHCGNIGCLETLCSTKSLLEDIKEDLKNNSIYGNNEIEEMKISDIYNLYNQEDKYVVRNVEKNAEYMGIGISNAIKILDPALVILHGEVIKFGDKYLNIVRNSVAKNTFPKVEEEYVIQFSELGENVGLIGAASIVFENIFNLDSLDIAGHYILKRKHQVEKSS